MVIWSPLSMTLDTLEATDVLSETLLPFPELKRAARKYVTGNGPNHYPVPAISHVVYDAWTGEQDVFIAIVRWTNSGNYEMLDVLACGPEFD